MVRKKLIDYLEKNKITVYQFAKKSGIPQSTIRSIVQKEDYEVREGNIQKICAGMGMTPYEMFLTESDEAVFLNQDEIPVIKNYRKLHKEDQCRVQGYLDALLEKHEE
jgi:transcriptional regulator with XRE-family HTH domain